MGAMVVCQNFPLTVPPREQDEFARLTSRQRREVNHWLVVLKRLWPGESRAKAAARLGISEPTLYRKLAAFKAKGWCGLVPDWKNPAGGPPQAFVDWWRNFAESNQRATAPAIRAVHRMWRHREPIPGYEGWPNLPLGLSKSTLQRLKSPRVKLKSFRIGKAAVAGLLPQTFSTRVGLWVGSHIQLDDMMGDFFVNVLEKKQAVRPLFLHALDCFSGNVPERPRPKNFRKEKQDGLLERDTRLLVAALAEMLMGDLGVERRLDGSYFEFFDKELSLDPLRYEAVLTGADGGRREARRGKKYMTLVNPFAPA
jgi:hypothetical protein